MTDRQKQEKLREWAERHIEEEMLLIGFVTPDKAEICNYTKKYKLLVTVSDDTEEVLILGAEEIK